MDQEVGIDGKDYTTNHATIWRWREGYQYDFAAHIDWSNTDSFKKANHRPVAAFDGNTTLDIVHIKAKPEETIKLSAAGSSDPDGDALKYRWIHYRDTGSLPHEI